MKHGKEVDFKIHYDGSLRFKGRWFVPQKCEEIIKRRLMEEGHNIPYSVCHKGDELYKDLEEIYWWPNMKREVTNGSVILYPWTLWLLCRRREMTMILFGLSWTNWRGLLCSLQLKKHGRRSNFPSRTSNMWWDYMEFQRTSFKIVIRDSSRNFGKRSSWILEQCWRWVLLFNLRSMVRLKGPIRQWKIC